MAVLTCFLVCAALGFNELLKEGITWNTGLLECNGIELIVKTGPLKAWILIYKENAARLAPREEF